MPSPPPPAKASVAKASQTKPMIAPTDKNIWIGLKGAEYGMLMNALPAMKYITHENVISVQQ